MKLSLRLIIAALIAIAGFLPWQGVSAQSPSPCVPFSSQLLVADPQMTTYACGSVLTETVDTAMGFNQPPEVAPSGFQYCGIPTPSVIWVSTRADLSWECVNPDGSELDVYYAAIAQSIQQKMPAYTATPSPVASGPYPCDPTVLPIQSGPGEAVYQCGTAFSVVVDTQATTGSGTLSLLNCLSTGNVLVATSQIKVVQCAAAPVIVAETSANSYFQVP